MVSGKDTRGLLDQARWPVFAVILSGMSAYYAAEIQASRVDGALEATAISVERRIATLEAWQDRTENNRFTSVDGEKMRQLFEAALLRHDNKPAHGEVRQRLTRLETKMDAISEAIARLEKK